MNTKRIFINKIMAFVLVMAVIMTAITSEALVCPAEIMGQPRIYIENSQTTNGSYNTMYVYGSDFENISGVEFSIHYDENVMEVSDVYVGDMLSSSLYDINKETSGTIKISAISSDGINGSGILCYFSFYVPEDADAGNYPIRITPGEVYNGNLESIQISNMVKYLSVLKRHQDITSVEFYGSVSNYWIMQGDEFTYSLYSADVKNLASGNFVFTYDSDCLELIDVTVCDSMKKHNALFSINKKVPGVVKISYINDQAIGLQSWEQMFQLKFKLKQDTDGDTTIRCTTTGLLGDQLNSLAANPVDTWVYLQKRPIPTPELILICEKQLPGEYVDIKVALSEGSNLAAGDFIIRYDTSQLLCTNVNSSSETTNDGGIVMINNNFGNGEVKFSFVNPNGVTKAQTLLTMRLQVVNGFIGYTYLSSEGRDVVNAEYEDVTMNHSGLEIYIEPVPVKGISLNKQSIRLKKHGQSEQLQAFVVPENAINKEVWWYSDNWSVASVDQSGLVTAGEVGEATIYVRTNDGGFETSCKVVVYCEHRFSEMWEYDDDNHWHICECGEKSELEAHRWVTIIDSNPTEESYGWSHEECSICHRTRYENTMIDPLPHTHRMVYQELIEATCVDNGIREHWYCEKCCRYYEDESGTNELYSIILPIDEHSHKGEIQWGMSITEHWQYCGLCMKDVLERQPHIFTEWEDVSDASKLTEHRFCKECPFEEIRDKQEIVIPPVAVTGVSLNKQEISLEKNGQTEQLEAIILPGNAGDKMVRWYSDNPMVAVVDQSGMVTSREVGEANIYVITNDGGYQASCKVIVFCNHVFTDNWSSDDDNHWQYCLCGEMSESEPHKWKKVIDVYPTEYSSGFYHEECTECSRHRLENSIIEPITHIHEMDFHSYQAPTCISDGVCEYWYCKKCGNNYGDEAGFLKLQEVSIPMDEHNHIGEIKLGLSEFDHWEYCDQCGRFISLPQPHEFTEWEDVVETEKATEQRMCIHCKHVETRDKEVVSYGDVNGDGNVDATDALAVLKHAAKLNQLSESFQVAADVNKDGIIDAMDALKILKVAAKIDVGFE